MSRRGFYLASLSGRDPPRLTRRGFPFLDELLLQQNAGLAEVTQLAKEIGLSRPTVTRYLEALETTQAITVLRPFHGGGRQELVSQPKIYGFDTGFVAYSRGWTDLRPDDCGHLLENLVLESLQAIPSVRGIYFWRTKQQKEIDFIVPVGRGRVQVIECKWKSTQFDPAVVKSFRKDYPHGENFLVTSDAHLQGVGKSGDLRFKYLSIEKFRAEFETHIKGQ